MRFAGQDAYHRYEGLVQKAEEGPRLVADLGKKHVMFLKTTEHRSPAGQQPNLSYCTITWNEHMRFKLRLWNPAWL